MNALATLPKLAKTLGMLGSEHDGEVLAAARQAERLRRQMGAAWSDLISPVAGGSRAARGGGRGGGGDTPPRPPDPADDWQRWRALVAWCLLRPEVLTAWERAFLAALPGFPRLSPRQAEILDGIAAKVAAG